MKLENLINQNRDLFDENEPDAGHFERFQNKLNQNKSQKSSLKVYLMAASIVAVSLFATLLVYMIQAEAPQFKANSGIALHEVSDEYKEVETYYNNYIQDRMTELDHIQCQNPGLQKSNFMQEINEFDEMYSYLKQELKESGGNERVINAMIETYQKKAEMLDQVLQIIKQNC